MFRSMWFWFYLEGSCVNGVMFWSRRVSLCRGVELFRGVTRWEMMRLIEKTTGKGIERSDEV